MVLRGIFLVLLCLITPPAAEAGVLRERREITFSPKAVSALTEREPDIPKILETVTLYEIAYEVDGLRVTGYAAAPKTAGPHPALIWNRGGNREFGAWNAKTAALVLGRVASWGYVVAAPQYRGNGGGEGREEFGGADLADVLALIPLLEEWPGADASRLGIYGQSRGGMMTYLALAASDRFAAAVVDAGVADLAAAVAQRPDMARVAAELIPDWAIAREDALRQRSAVQWVDRLCATTPLLLLHGIADERVPSEQARRMAEALQALGRPHDLRLFDGGDHSLSQHRALADAAIRAWFDTHLAVPAGASGQSH